MDRILGQPHAIETLKAALSGGRLPHAWIFAGPPGVGKLTTAIAFARAILDPDGPPDGRAARLLDAGSHPDLHVIRKEMALFSADSQVRGRKQMNIPVAVIREHVVGGDVGGKFVDSPAFMTPVLADAKVFVIDEAELLEREGFSALLKTLEEPPPRTYVILVTSRPSALPPTIHSRCQRVRFGPLDDDAMAAWFARTHIEVSGAERRWIETFCDGSPGLAQLAAEHGFHRWQEALDPMLDEISRGRFPAGMGAAMAGFIDAFAKAWVKANTNASKDAANKDGARHMFALLGAHARRRLAEALGDEDEREHWLRAIDLLREAERQLVGNVNQKILLENLVVQWTVAGAIAPA